MLMVFLLGMSTICAKIILQIDLFIRVLGEPQISQTKNWFKIEHDPFLPGSRPEVIWCISIEYG